ncbi:ligand-binding sensor domain-containing protein [Rhizosphaericola mali]|uniref:HTH luxR-type domain-containing protein n=1 Tax=Rhizosphaericola mali TaxID=2545455 RepID=A0A5P2G4J4_9BACT|nr:hypothetical protein [Rhizosphaericola mali]QES89608.1 hypothetical protein E0W69_013360 [Rhizosphaericola mali]
MKKNIQIFLFVMAFVLNSVAAQNLSSFTPQIINFYKSQYGASNQNWAVDQTKDGAIVVGNNKGLLIANAGEWHLYELPGQKIVRCVAAAKDGRIYTGAYGEFGYWSKVGYGDWQYTSLNKLIKDKRFERDEFWKILLAKDGNVYFQSFGALYKYQNNKITSIPIPGNIMYLFEVNDELYFQVLGKGLYRLRNNLSEPLVLDDRLTNDEIISILPAPEYGIMVGTVHYGLFRFWNGQFTPLFPHLTAYLSRNQLNAGAVINKNSYAFGTIENGILQIDAQGNILNIFNQHQGLQNNTILGLNTDNIGNLWCAMDKGFAEIALHSPFRYFKDLGGDFGSVYSGVIFQNQLYIGTNQGLFYRNLNGQEEDFQRISGLDGQIWNLSVIDGQLFCGHNKGTCLIENHQPIVLSDISGGTHIAFPQNNDSVLLQGTYVGLAVFKKNRNQWSFSNIVKGTEFIPINDWLQDSTGRFWISHMYKGIYLAEISKDYTSVKTIKDLSHAVGLNPKYKEWLFSYQGNILLTSGDGIYQPRLIHQNIYFERDVQLEKKFAPIYNAKKIFYANHTYWGVFDDNVVRIVSGDFSKNYTYNFKDFSLVGGYENIVPLTDQTVLLCGENGFAMYDSDKFSNHGNASFKLNNFYYLENGRLKAVNWDGKVPLSLSYNHNDLSFSVDFPIYDREVLFQFRLNRNGTIGSWSNWTKIGTQNYTNLNAGDYTIEAKNNITNQIITYDFHIKDPWYWNLLAKITYVIIGLLILYSIRKRIEQRHANALQKKQREMDEKLRLQKLEHEHQLLVTKQDVLQKEVEVRSEDLANSANELIKRKRLLNKMHNELEKINDVNTNNNNIKKLSKELDRQLQLDKQESRLFEKGFNTIHDQFFQKLLTQFPDLTPADLKLAAYLRMNMGSKEIAPLLNITIRGVELKRYRLRKKLQLNADSNLNEFMMKF